MLKKPLTKSNTPSCKGHGDIKDTRNISKHNKINLQQADSHHQIKWREIPLKFKAIPLKSGTRQGC